MSDLSLKISNNDPIKFNKGFYAKEIDDSKAVEIMHNFNEKSFNGWYKELIFNHFKIGYGCFNVTKKTIIDINFKGQTIALTFLIKGNINFNYHGLYDLFPFKDLEHNIFFSDNLTGKMEMNPDENQLLFINICPDYFNGLLPKESKFNNLRNAMNNKQALYVNDQNLAISPRMKFLLDEIMQCGWNDHYRKIHLKAKVLETLLLQLNQFKEEDKKKINSKLSSLEVEKIRNAKKYITEYYKNPLQLKQIAKSIGTNEFVLKKGFKSLYGTTVFSYINDIRMAKAKKLLLENKLTIAQISEYIGYKNPQHFSTAFKKTYGNTPTETKIKLTHND